MTELKPCPECNCTGVAETIGGYDRPCDACSGMGEIHTRAVPRTDGEDGELVVMLAGRCGHHFKDDCESCRSAIDVTNSEIRSLHARITALSAEVLRMGKSGWQSVGRWERDGGTVPGPVQVAVELLIDRPTPPTA